MEILFVIGGLLIIVLGLIMWRYRTRDLGPDDEVDLGLGIRQDRNWYEGMRVLVFLAFGFLVLLFGLTCM